MAPLARRNLFHNKVRLAVTLTGIVFASIILPKEVAISMFGLTLLMCIGASVVSINKVTRIDPAMVFKG